MVCSNCGSEVAAGSPTCARCGAPQPAGVAPGAQAHGYQQQQQNPAPGGGWSPAPTYGGGQAPQASGFNFDITRWQRAEQITGGATLLLIISIFLPWFTADGLQHHRRPHHLPKRVGQRHGRARLPVAGVLHRVWPCWPS